MLVPTDPQRFAQLCAAIGNEAATDEGFVAIHRLVDRLGATLLLRPLLVEGMIASIDGAEIPTPSPHQWAVLVDSDTYPITPAELQRESFGKPLPWRFRNTVAHELVHLLAFRAKEFGIRARDVSTIRGRPEAIVKAIERETERLSPLLLWPEIALKKFLAGKTEAISVADLVGISNNIGVSRQVLINRLNLIPEGDPLRLTRGLRNAAVGVAEWIDKRMASFRGWPLFVNFDRNIAPAFLLDLKEKQERIPASSVVPDVSFALCGGWGDLTTFESRAGVSGATDTDSMRVQVSIEWVERAAGKSFLFVATKTTG
jgi:hypothetical protein